MFTAHPTAGIFQLPVLPTLVSLLLSYCRLTIYLISTGLQQATRYLTVLCGSKPMSGIGQLTSDVEVLAELGAILKAVGVNVPPISAQLLAKANAVWFEN